MFFLARDAAVAVAEAVAVAVAVKGAGMEWDIVAHGSNAHTHNQQSDNALDHDTSSLAHRDDITSPLASGSR